MRYDAWSVLYGWSNSETALFEGIKQRAEKALAWRSESRLVRAFRESVYARKEEYRINGGAAKYWIRYLTFRKLDKVRLKDFNQLFYE